MGIHLDLKDYCQECSQFDPDVEKRNIYLDGKSFNDTSIRCARRDICSNLARLFEDRAKEESLYEP